MADGTFSTIDTAVWNEQLKTLHRSPLCSAAKIPRRTIDFCTRPRPGLQKRWTSFAD
jgi:hypothetical protein